MIVDLVFVLVEILEVPTLCHLLRTPDDGGKSEETRSSSRDGMSSSQRSNFAHLCYLMYIHSSACSHRHLMAETTPIVLMQKKTKPCVRPTDISMFWSCMKESGCIRRTRKMRRRANGQHCIRLAKTLEKETIFEQLGFEGQCKRRARVIMESRHSGTISLTLAWPYLSKDASHYYIAMRYMIASFR